MRTDVLQRFQRLLAIVAIFCALAIGWRIVRASSLDLGSVGNLPLSLGNAGAQIALISGHAGFDPGAVCEDASGRATLTEAEVNARITERVAALLRSRGHGVLVLEEYDVRLNGLQADLLLSLHADSCTVPYSGYKAAHRLNSPIAPIEGRLLECIDTHYPAATDLAPHPNTITHDMTENHIFRRVAPQTPAAILEMGFLGGDQMLLTQQPDRVARGIAESIECFLEPPAEPSS